MSQQSVEIVEAAFAAYMADDAETLRRLVSPEIVISNRPDQPDVRDHRGYDGMLQAAAEWLEAWDEHTFEAASFWAVGDRVFVATRESARGAGSGVRLETESVFVSTVRDGRIVRLQIFGSERDALAALGLGE
jgi:ketosteroid isomerase-like protein